MAEEQVQQEDEVESSSMGLMSHLIELRDRLLRVVLAVMFIFLCLFYWANDIYTYLAGPLTRHLPEGTQMIAIDVASPFLTPFKLVLMLSVFLGMPFILHQIWSFVAPGLYRHEKRLAGPLLASSILLFYSGMLFAFYVVFPLVFGFFTSVGPEMVSISTDIGRYLDFVISLFFGFGIAFEIPIATIILVAMGITTPTKLAEKRPYVIVGAFIAGMILTPPDIISQVLLAVPMWILFESGVIASKYIFADRLKKEAEDEAAEENSIGGDSNYVDEYDVVDDPADTETLGSHEEYEPLTDQEMEAEMDRIDAEIEEEENFYDDDDEDDDAYVDSESEDSSDSKNESEIEDDPDSKESKKKKQKTDEPPSPEDSGP